MAESAENVPSEAPFKRKLEVQQKLEIAISKKLRTVSGEDDLASLGETEQEAGESLEEQVSEIHEEKEEAEAEAEHRKILQAEVEDCKTGGGGGEICVGAMVLQKNTLSVSGKDEEEGKGEGKVGQEYSTIEDEEEGKEEEEEEEEEDDDEEEKDDDDDTSELDEDTDEDSDDEGERSLRQEGTSSKGKEKIDSKGKGIMVDTGKGKGKMEDEEVINEDDAGYLSEDPLEEVDLNNILPTRTRRSSSTMEPPPHVDAVDLAGDDDEEDDDYYNDE